jgi:hypothetical protein
VSRGDERFGEANYEEGEARVYRVESVPPLPAPGQGEFSLDFQRNGQIGHLVTLRYNGPQNCLFQLRFDPLGGQEFVADQNIQAASARASMQFMVPYQVGEYRIQARLSGEAPWQDFGTFSTSK